MTKTDLVVTSNLVVSLDYTLRLQSGQVVDSSNGKAPLDFLPGQGQIIPGLEQALYGMKIGQEKDVVVEPVDGYGERDPNALQTVPRNAFPADLDLTIGRTLNMRDSNTQQVFQAIVREVRDDSAVLDFNHPLAGEVLHFHVKVTGLRQPTDEELDHGHVHHAGHNH